MENRSHQDRDLSFLSSEIWRGETSCRALAYRSLLRIENPSVSRVCVFLPWEGVTVVVSGQVMSTFGMKVQTDTIDAWGMWTCLWRSLVRWGLCCMVSCVCIVQMGGHPLLPLKLASTYLLRQGDHSARAQNRPFLLLTCECPCVAIY